MIKGKAFVLAAFAALSAGTPAHAQFCASEPMHLPWLSGPPNWFGPGSSTAEWRPQFDDPRWASAPLIHLCDNLDLTACSGGTDQAEFRLVVDGTTLYVAVRNLADDNSTSADSVLIALADSSNNSAKAARIRLRPSPTIANPDASVWTDPLPAPTHVAGTGTSDATVWEATDADGGVASDWTQALGIGDDVPAGYWVKDVATWANASGNGWSMTMKIDLTQFGYSAAPITAPIKLFVGTRHVPTAGSAILVPNVASVTERVGGTATSIPADEANWTTFSAPGACSAGIAIGWSNIGVDDGTTNLSSTIKACSSGNMTPPCPGATNRFRIKPQGVPSAISGVAHTIRARFRLANWGSTMDHANAPFEDIEGSAPFAAAGTCPGAGWCWNSTGPVIDFQCGVTGSNAYCPVISNASATNFHHCMLVQLDSEPGANHVFQTASAYRNMNFVGLSKHSEEATISIQGAKDVTGVAQDRDVYLYVQRTNMPPARGKGMTLPKEAMQTVLQYAQTPPALPRQLKDPGDPEGRRRNAELAQRFQKFTPAGLADAAKAVAAPPASNPLSVPTLSAGQAMQLVWPTYKVFAYYDTGKKTDVEGAQVPVLGYMVPFGLYLNHDGEFFGFADELVGAAGAVLDPIANAPNWFKVRVPSEGSVKVNVTVEALEEPLQLCPDGTKKPCKCPDGSLEPCKAPTTPPTLPPPPCFPWWWVIVLGFVILVLIVGIIRKKPAP